MFNVAKRIVIPEQEVIRPLPVNIESCDLPEFEPKTRMRLPEVSIHFFKNVFLHEYGAVYNRINPFPESLATDEHLPDFSWKTLVKDLLKKKLIRLNKTPYISMHTWFSSGYFDWLLDFLPRYLIAGNLVNQYPILLPKHYLEDEARSGGDVKRLTMAAFGINNVHYLPSDAIFWVKELILPSHPAPPNEQNAFFAQAVRERILNYFKERIDSSPLNFPRLYVSRARSARRKILNEEELVAVLKRYEFEVVYFEDYGFIEQVALSSRAQIIVTPHGAGESNALFMNPNSLLFELRGQRSNTLAYYNLAAALGLRYWYQYGQLNVNMQEVEERFRGKPTEKLYFLNLSDFTIDCVKFEKNLQNALKELK